MCEVSCNADMDHDGSTSMCWDGTGRLSCDLGNMQLWINFTNFIIRSSCVNLFFFFQKETLKKGTYTPCGSWAMTIEDV